MLLEPERPDHPRAPKGPTVKDGFLVEKLYDVPKAEQGSARVAGPDGTLFASDQYKNKEGRSLYQIKPPPWMTMVARPKSSHTP